MKCYYCHHRNGDCFLNINRTVVVLCESCANRSMTLRNLSMKFRRASAPPPPQPQGSFEIKKISHPSA